MIRRKIQNNELDVIGAKLLKTGKLTGDEIDAIVANKDLIRSVRARIEAGPISSASRRPLFMWKPISASLAVAAIAVALSFGYFGTRKAPETAVSAPVDFDPPKAAIAPVTEPAVTQKADVLPVRVQIERPAVTKASFVEPKRASRPKPQPTPSKAIGEFYALSNTGNIEEELRRGGRVVRVDMPRSSLFAMGVDLPLENDSKYITTDLIVGADGVPRAIRFLD